MHLEMSVSKILTHGHLWYFKTTKILQNWLQTCFILLHLALAWNVCIKSIWTHSAPFRHSWYVIDNFHKIYLDLDVWQMWIDRIWLLWWLGKRSQRTRFWRMSNWELHSFCWLHNNGKYSQKISTWPLKVPNTPMIQGPLRIIKTSNLNFETPQLLLTAQQW